MEAKFVNMEKTQKQRETELLRNEFAVAIHKTISEFKSNFVNRKLTKLDIIHVLSAIVSNKSK